MKTTFQIHILLGAALLCAAPPAKAGFSASDWIWGSAALTPGIANAQIAHTQAVTDVQVAQINSRTQVALAQIEADTTRRQGDLWANVSLYSAQLAAQVSYFNQQAVTQRLAMQLEVLKMVGYRAFFIAQQQLAQAAYVAESAIALAKQKRDDAVSLATQRANAQATLDGMTIRANTDLTVDRLLASVGTTPTRQAVASPLLPAAPVTSVPTADPQTAFHALAGENTRPHRALASEDVVSFGGASRHDQRAVPTHR